MVTKGKSRRSEEKHFEKNYCRPAELVQEMVFSSDGSGLLKSNGVVVEGKISYFGMARNLIRHLISPNQDDLSYSARAFLYGQQEIG